MLIALDYIVFHLKFQAFHQFFEIFSELFKKAENKNIQRFTQ